MYDLAGERHSKDKRADGGCLATLALQVVAIVIDSLLHSLLHLRLEHKHPCNTSLRQESVQGLQKLGHVPRAGLSQE